MAKRLNLRYVKEEFKKRGFTLTSTEYKGCRQPLNFICDKGHSTSIKWVSFSQGCGCSICAVENQRHSYEYVEKCFEERGYTLITKKYTNKSQKLKFICDKGHRHSISFSSLLKGGGCSKCALNRPKTHSEAADCFLKAGFILLDEYKNSYTPLRYRCSNGHYNYITLGNLKSGWGCPDCSGNKKKTIEQVRDYFSSKGCILLSTEYKNSKSKLEYICSEGHETSTCWSDFNQGYGCLECSGKRKKTIEEVRESFSVEGFELLTDEYINCNSLLEYTCPKGHRGSISYASFMYGNRCSTCSGKKKKTYKEVKEKFNSEGYKLLSTSYVNSHQYLRYECPAGHRHKIKVYHFYQGGRCPSCYNTSSSSRAEVSLKDSILEKFPSLEIVSNTRKIISPKELDIYIPDKNLAIEYCGVYWHSTAFKTNKYYHFDKMKKCYDKGIRLITVFEDEYLSNKKEVMSKIYSIIKDINTPVYRIVDDILISDLRYDSFDSASFYNSLGFSLDRQTSPASKCIIGSKRVRHYSPELYRIYDCGKIFYRKV